jgi:hypothetical protein
MSFDDFKSITVWPKEDEARPLVFLVYGLVWFLVLLGIAWTAVGFYATSQLVENGTHVKILNCNTQDQAPSEGCSDTTTGNYIKGAISFDAEAAGVVVATVTLFTYIGHASDQKRRKDTLKNNPVD